MTAGRLVGGSGAPNTGELGWPPRKAACESNELGKAAVKTDDDELSGTGGACAGHSDAPAAWAARQCVLHCNLEHCWCALRAFPLLSEQSGAVQLRLRSDAAVFNEIAVASLTR